MEYAAKYSDDGEPSGTVGKPIFAAIESEDFDRVCIPAARSSPPSSSFAFTTLWIL